MMTRTATWVHKYVTDMTGDGGTLTITPRTNPDKIKNWLDKNYPPVWIDQWSDTDDAEAIRNMKRQIIDWASWDDARLWPACEPHLMTFMGLRLDVDSWEER